MHKVLHTSDLHGSTICFEKLIEVAAASNANAVVISGDLTGKFFVPIIQLRGGLYESYVGEIKETAKDGDELADLERRISTLGGYSKVFSKEEFVHFKDCNGDQLELFDKEMRHRLQEWLWYAARKLRPLGVRLLITAGNDDVWSIDDLLRADPYVEAIDFGPVTLWEDCEVIGESYGNPTPYHCPRDVSERELKARLAGKMSNLKKPEGAILVAHVPPYNSGIDSAPKLDSERRPIVKGGQILMAPAGSTAVREVIEEYQPLVSLHGHIHEDPGKGTIGKTVCFNPGSEYHNGTLRGIVIRFDSGKITGWNRIER